MSVIGFKIGSVTEQYNYPALDNIPDGLGIQGYVEDWLDEHPEATTTVQGGSITEAKLASALKLKTLKDYITPQMFGAVGDGVTNDYGAFSDCVNCANSTGQHIFVPAGTYYINGIATIQLGCNVICDNATFLVGSNHEKTALPVFAYLHDSESSAHNVSLSDVFSSDLDVTNTYKDKFFVLDTKIAYGTGVGANTPNDETIKETFFTNGVQARVYFDSVANHTSRTVDVTNISDMKETGYVFSGATIKQAVQDSYGICFINIRRNNMTVRDLKLECNNALGEGTVILCEYCNALTVENIKSLSEQPADWGYELAAYYCANLYINDFKGFNNWSTIATRGLKNYTLKNSIANTFDCHWNAYGEFICDGCILYKDAHIGYGKGTFAIRDTICDYIKPRRDFVQIWAGEIIIENVTTNSGLWIYLEDNTVSGYDSFFDDIELPRIQVSNFKSAGRQLYVRVPNDIMTRIQSHGVLVLNDTIIDDIDSPNTNVIYDTYLHNIPFVTGVRSDFSKFSIIKYDDMVASDYSDQVSTASGTTLGDSFTSIGLTIRKCGCVVTISFSGVLSATLTAWKNLFAVPTDVVPNSDIYVVGVAGNTASSVIIRSGSGNVAFASALSETGKRVTFMATFIKTKAE